MSDFWWKEKCPNCFAVNWIHSSEPDGDSSKMDTDGFNCWKCKKDILLYSGEYQDIEYIHVEGSETFDDYACGDRVDGQEKPD